jgi:DNA-binding transcriptional ArsR family regulator
METATRATTHRLSRTLDRCCTTTVLPVLSEAAVALAAKRFKALADPTRLTILATLAANPEPVCACDLGDDVDLEQPTVAHHLKVLRNTGLIVAERRGKWAYYRLQDDAAAWVRATLAGLPR